MADQRLELIVSLVEERGFVSIKELSQLFDVSEVTIRRAVQRLDEENRLRRTHGGVVPLPSPTARSLAHERLGEGFFTDRVDVLIATSIGTYSDRVLLAQAEKRNIPIVAESLDPSGSRALVAVDNHAASLALGRWAGHYAQQHFDGQANVLDLTYHLRNTLARSHGFIAGLREVLPEAQTILSINAQSAWQPAYQVTLDALHVYPSINVIFAINDATAGGAIEACRQAEVDPASILVLPFGLEGNTLRDALLEGEYCKAGLAMFPEIVGPVCIEAAIKACNGEMMSRQLITPHAVLTSQTLSDFYTRTDAGWQINWENVQRQLTIPLPINPPAPREQDALPRRIGFVVPHVEHEWYQNLLFCMQRHVERLQVELEIVDADQNLKDEVTLRRRAIAHVAATQVQPGEVILVGTGQISVYLAEELAKLEHEFTVITFGILHDKHSIGLISTGGQLRRATDALVGPTAEEVLRGLRADKCLLEVAGFTIEFGLSHTNLSEVTIKQAMIRAAREVILMADHTQAGQESVVQIAPTNVVSKLISDNALPASTRLDLAKAGIEVVLAQT
jgi:ribose transport system substrate-binding protein